MSFLLLFCLLSVYGVSVGQIILDGECSANIPSVNNFNLDSFQNVWYELLSTPTSLSGDCSSFEVTTSGQTATASYKVNSQNFLTDYTGPVSVVGSTSTLSLTLPQVSSNPVEVHVINTDYANYAVLYRCEPYSATQKQVYIWHLARQNSFFNDFIPTIMNNTIYEFLGITNDDLSEVNQEDDVCFQLPLIEYGQPVILSGQCDTNISGVANFDAGRFLGVWHEVASYYSENALGTCGRAQYSDGNGVVNVVNSQVINQQLLTIVGNATVASTDGTGKLNVILEVLPGVLGDSELLILATDYDQWAVSYTCENLPDDRRRIFSWIVSRTRELPDSARNQVNQVIDSFVELNDRYYEPTDQTNNGCFYFPDPEPGQVNIFGGQCDMSIPVQSNFDAVGYMNLWHTIEMYPAPFQDGTCSNAFYTLRDGQVDVFNTQVIDQRLDTINGFAIPVGGTDAKLVVSFPVAGTNLTTETDYWVISTDYTSYSLVYSCTNINSYQQQVTVWKLSRTKELSVAASNAINSAMANIPVLDQRYFEDMDQSRDGCFYFPEPTDEPVVFPGQCSDNDIPVVANIDLNRFQGLWHEIEAYPKDDQDGQCINHRFDISTTTTSAFNLESSSVVNQFIGVTQSTVTYSSNDNSGRFIISFNSNGNLIEIPYWIVDTDYDNYALAYSCVNINNDFRGVYSWKLSRTKELLSNANTAINNVIANIPLLDNVYYENIGQSESACFYLPELDFGEPIIIPGQCDTTITGVQNFDAGRFLGVWHEVASYFSESALGTCGRAQYSDGNGVVNVVNSQVINQQLLTIVGNATVASTDGTGKLNVILEILPGVLGEMELLVLATDYDQWAVSYTCENLPDDRRRIFSWIVSRTRELPDSARNQVNQVIDSFVELNDRYYEPTDQTNNGCFYFPDPEPGQVNIFGGQCDMSIPVQSNFDAVGYMNLWHTIEMYPAPFQDGTCSNAFYTLRDGQVDVFNTQVIDQRLDTINGFAIPVGGTDAKLVVSFPVAGTNLTTETDYWVISTDYTAYSLVYSCTNINSYQQQVTVWKLSRTKELSVAASNAINSAMANIPVLDQRYFEDMDQSRDGCFYFPEPTDEPVKFPGQCGDDDIPVVTNFNLNAFEGVWHEIETYPKDDQDGQCISHAFTVSSNNGFSLQSSSVIAQTLGITEGNVIYSANDNSGRFIISFISNGNVIQIPYWIVDTDYNNYALAYSCVNVDNDFRNVYSWKLSRNRQLSETSSNAINNVINNIRILDNSYFEDVNQSDDACFYYPELAYGEPVVLPGQCDTTITGVQNFDAGRFLGVWHEVASYYSDSALGTCSRAQYSDGNGVVNVVNSQVINQQLLTIVGNATVASTDGTGKLNVILEVLPGVLSQTELLILATDYDQWAVSYTCENLPNDRRRIYSWIVSRTRELPDSARNQVNQVIDSFIELDDRYYEPTDQTNNGCFYFPDPEPGQVNIFGGQCDMSIPVQSNFDAVGYMNLWHTIEMYPAPFQDGTCSNAFYTLRDGQVDVFNTQVIDQRLDTINGFAIPVGGTDAKLVVSFPVAGTNLTTETDYWVISTDYTSYSLVYSCTNINSYQQQVTVWKLSRTKELSVAASNAINSAMTNIPVLDQRYFEDMDQSRDGCFYFPEPTDEPVVFPGQCGDENIPFVANIDLNRFQGLWHEIEAYPKDDQDGQCINHRFDISTTTTSAFNLESSSVMNQFIGVTQSTVTYSSNDNSGRFIISFNSNGNLIEIPYWIVDTDYDNYALAYSCVNIDNDFRGVYSWKLSRTKALSSNFNTAINNVIANIPILDNVYYEDINQSENACFYLPELDYGEPIILPGQCDTTITGVQNFDAGRFLGVWHEVASYFSESALGTCGRAQYSDGNGVVNVVNSQVINQQLLTIVGNATVASTDGTGKLNVILEILPGVLGEMELLVLATDYDQWAVSYTCENLPDDRRRIFSWIVSRTRELPDSARNQVNQVIDSFVELNDRYYEPTDQTNNGCFYFPDPEPGQVNIFGGQCDMSIPVQSNFDAVGYMNLWHTIEMYPAPFQDGTCSNAFYTLRDGQVDVFNTQVIDQRLDTINGFAIPVGGTDAKLVVSFPVAGTNLTTETDYWVISTDYTSYSLVYSCTNINSYQQQVTVWKLSRTKELSVAASNAINSAMANIPVLDQRYFEDMDQSRDGCFYFPEPTDEPVKFPGQCGDEDIPVVTNFNLNAFEGVWHEIETYPKDDQDGQCISHAFTVSSNNGFSLQSSSVIAQTLGITEGNMIYSANDNSGRFIISFISNGNVIQIPYWIVDTDYNNYALAYSCVNVDNDFRNVYSWKLSRNRQLSVSSSNAINNVMDNIQILNNSYFEVVDQTDDGCFYYPELAYGEPVVLPGQCNTNISGVQAFDAGRFLGVWHEVASYFSESALGTCSRAQYSDGNGVVNVLNSQVINQQLLTIVGNATVASTDGTGKLNVILEVLPGVLSETELLILATDYDQWAVSYTCQNLPDDRRRIFTWIVSRTRVLPDSARNQVNQVIDSFIELDDRYYEPTDQTNDGCFYFPEPGQPTVVFGGQCDPNIQVVSNFDAVAYMNLWYDIESYPMQFQDGTCANAFYTLIGGEVDVFNTQVVNQTLDTITGVAVPVGGTDAKLVVTFPVAGTNFTIDSDYWVISTDYSSYSLVYSCRNINDYQQEVTSWKLSRTKQLSATANTVINNAISNIPVLNQNYYETMDQTREGCFYLPEPTGEPVLFPGQCGDEEIPVVANFNLTRFDGVWHEWAAYPKDDQEGQCISHRFTESSANGFTLQSYNVIAQSLGVTDGTVTYSSNDNSGRFTITFTSNGNVIQIPYWIVDTDYDSYALAYSCVNSGDDYREVYSWKLSRSRSISTEANMAITNFMSNINILDNRYFESIDQSDEACFYFPDLAPGESVVFPGQCDTNVSVVQNFDAARYLNTWRLIETYPSDFQLGDCAEALYTLGPDGVIVENTEVINESLSTMFGAAVVASTDGSGVLLVTFPDAPPLEYYILATDYESYSLVYSCININDDQRRVFSWKLSRTNTLSQEAEQAINQVMNSLAVLDQRYYETVNRSPEACFYYPEPNGEPVVFRGECDQSITVVSNFQPQNYSGIWYNIESYPAPFQDGTCGIAEYTLDPETLVVFVENTQVVNQTLDVQNGTAVVASTDGTAKLSVTFDVNGVIVTTDYWVLATDYSSYSLVYSCQDVGDGYKQVNSWKLSRTKSLPANSLPVIASVIENVKVLDERYYELEGQSEEDCFFYPDNNGGPVILSGQCIPDSQVQAVTDFNATMFAGAWQELSRFPNSMQSRQCVSSDFSFNAQNVLTITQTDVADEVLFSNTISGSLPNSDRAAFAVNGVEFENLYVLGTDYSAYALLYACRNIDNNYKQIYSWKLSKVQDLPSSAINAIDQIVDDNIDLSERYYEETSRSNDACFYYPEFLELPSAIELPGPCDQSIRGISNFDAAGYLGTWYEIEKYPDPNQFGTCDRALYELDSEAVLVTNTQVVNQTLDVQLGTAVVASTDGTGLLNVTFEVNGVIVHADYYILATDYISYSLVYSCRNLDNGNRLVSSWKLSRTTALTPQAISQMNDVINQTQGLKQEYYTPTSQSAEDCYYIPEVGNQAPLFRWQCGNTASMTNFNAAEFAGWWHEIERYPQDVNPGECTSSHYTESGGSYQVVDTSVSNGTGIVVTSAVQITSDGRLVRTLGNGVQQEIIVLATDYNNYALLFSCEQVNSEYARVWSAKHSKTRQLSTADQQAMSSVIENNRLLYPQFYQSVDQTDEACFFYPILSGNLVTIPGQCDENIPLVENFDAAEFAGNWYQIERYPQPYENQESTCSGVRFGSTTDSSEITVLNWQVLDGVLQVVERVAILADDGRGNVTIPIGGESPLTMNLQLLDTDYEYYAIVYSCRNINDFQRNILAYKLSRSRTLSESASSTINQYIANRPELHQSYFVPVEQNDECEEPSSGALVKSSIIVMFVCVMLQYLL